MKVVIGGNIGLVDLAIRRYVDLYGRSHVEKLPIMESRVLDELKEYNQKLESIKLENRKLYISSSKSDNQKQETDKINEIDSNQKQETAKTEEIDSNQKIETNKTERRKSIAERMKEGEDDPNDFWYNPTHEDLFLKPQDVKIMEGMLAFRDRLAKLSDSIPLDFSDMVCIGEKPEVGKSDAEEDDGEVARDVDDEEEKEGNSPNWGDNDDESGENESDDESDFDDGWGEPDSESSEESEESDWSDDGSDEKESEENAVDDEDDSDTWDSSEGYSEDDMNDGWGSDDSDDSDSTDENTEKEEESEESDSYDWNDMGSWDSEDSDDEDQGGETKGNEEGEESEDTNETTEDGNSTEVDTYEDDQGSWDLDGWSDDSYDDDTEVRVEKSEDDVKKDLKKVFGISLKTDKKEKDESRIGDIGKEKEVRREDIWEEKRVRKEEVKEEKEVNPRRENTKEEKKAKPRREDIGDVDDDFWNDESSEKEIQKPEWVVKKKEAPVSYDTSSLRGFVKSHKGCKCTIEEALQYFKKADIEKDLRMGRIFKGKKSLFI